MNFNSIHLVRQQLLGTACCSLLPGGSMRQNRCKIGRLTQAVRKVIPAPARFWDLGARWFVVRLHVLEQPGDELQQFF